MAVRVTRDYVEVLTPGDGDVRTTRLLIEVLLPSVVESSVFEEDVESTLSLTQSALPGLYIVSASSTIVLSQQIESNFYVVSATSDLSMDQTASTGFTLSVSAESTLSLGSDISSVFNPRQDLVSEIELLQAASYIGPKWVSANSAIALADDAYVPATLTLSASSAIELSQDEQLGGTRRLTAESTLDLSQIGDNSVKIRRATTEIVVTHSASYERILTVHSHIDLSQEVILGAVLKRAENQLDLEQVARYQPLPQTAESQIELGQSVRQNIRNIDVSSELVLSQDTTVLKPFRATGTSEISEQDWVVDEETGDVAWEEIALRDSASVHHTGVLSTSHHLSFHQEAYAGHEKASGTSVSATSALSLTDTAILNETGAGDSSLVLSQVATAWAARPGNSTLELSQAATFTITHAYNGTSALAVMQAATYTLIASCTQYKYSPFVGESSDPDAPTPPPETISGLLSGISAPFQLVYPSTGTPSETLTLRTPNLGNIDRLAFNRIQRETRGGTLVIYADPMWPKIQTLVLSFSSLTSEEAQALLTFIEDHIGQEVGLIDWEHRFWRGIITTPDSPIVQDRRCSYTASFEFQGEPDPSWTPP
jgi:hypothetical protein